MNVSWRDVARKDFEDAVRSKLLWGITAAFVGLLGIFFVVSYVADGDDIGVVEVLASLGQFTAFFVPLLALIAGYMAVVGERQSGSLRVLMSYPFSRLDVILGKVVGRTIVVTVATVVGVGALALLAVAFIGSIQVVEFLGFMLFTLLLALTFTGIAVGISSMTSTRGRALGLVVGVFFLLLVLWEAIAVAIYYLLNGTRPGLEVEAWYLFIYQLNPIDAYRFALADVLDSYVWPFVGLGLEDFSFAETEVSDRRLEARVDGSLPFYLQPWFSAVTFLAWAAVPVAVGYRRFQSSDLE